MLSYQWPPGCCVMLSCHCSTDYSSGFGGKFGVQKDRQDKSAAGWDYLEKVDKHESQKGPYREADT